MGIPAGPFYVDDLLTWTANTHTVTTGAATDADSVPTYRIYEDETGTAIATGSMAKLDDANTLGFYSEQITLSAANGYEVGKCYSIYISSTVNSVTATKSENFKVIATLATAAAQTTMQTSINTIDDFVDTEVAAIKVVTDKLDTALELDGAVYRYTTNALEQAPAGGGGGSAGAVWDEATSGHVTAGTFGKLVADINAKTTNLPPDPADASDIATAFGAIELAVDNVDEIAAAVWDEVLVDHLTAGSTGAALDTTSSGGSVPTAAEIATEVWDEVLADHLTAGSTGAALDTASSVLTAAEIATEVYDQTDGIEAGLTLRQAMRLASSALFGEASGLATTTATYRDFNDSKDRIVATVDVNGNRSALTRDAT